MQIFSPRRACTITWKVYKSEMRPTSVGLKKAFTHLITCWEQKHSYLQGEKLNELVQIFFILRTQATLHVVMILQSDKTPLSVVIHFFVSNVIFSSYLSGVYLIIKSRRSTSQKYIRISNVNTHWEKIWDEMRGLL